MSRRDGAIAAPTMPDCLAPRLPTLQPPRNIAKSIAVLSGASIVTLFLGGIFLATFGEASGLSIFVERPWAAAQIAVGLSFCLAMLAVPALRGLSRLWVRREVRLGGDAVEILRHTPLGNERHTVPLRTYEGIAHHVRASLSGLTHEIILVHPDSDFCVTLLTAERVTQGMLDECKSLFGLPEIPVRTIYERGGRKSGPSLSSSPSPARA